MLEQMAKQSKMMRLKSECLTCIVNMQADKFLADCTEEEKIVYKQRLFKVLSEAKTSESAPLLMKRIADIQKELFGKSTDYTQIKHLYNEYVMRKLSLLERNIIREEDPLRCAIQYSLTGNFIDFGAMKAVDNDKFEQLLMKAPQIELGKEYENLRDELEHTKRLVFLTDNCGEIVFDKALIQTIKKIYPNISITAIVRGQPVLNDATMEDAKQIGLMEECNVIGNGTNVAGTCLDLIAKEARLAIDSADIILSKGQGNFETLQDCGLNVYYLFMCKCQMFAKRFQVEQYEGLLINDKRKGI